MHLINSVVFDLGNVLIDWDPRYLYRKLFKTEEEVEWFLENICNDKWNSKHDAGYSFSRGINELSSIYPEFKQYIENWYYRWEEMLGAPMEGTIKILESLKKKKIPLSLIHISEPTRPY